MDVPHELVTLPGQIFRLRGRGSNATHELVFVASEVSPFGLVNYHVERINEPPESPARPAAAATGSATPHNSSDEEVTIDNGVRSSFRVQNAMPFCDIYLFIRLFLFDNLWVFEVLNRRIERHGCPGD